MQLIKIPNLKLLSLEEIFNDDMLHKKLKPESIELNTDIL